MRSRAHLGATVRRLLQRFVPRRVLRRLRHPTIVPGYYNTLVAEIEAAIDRQQDDRQLDSSYYAAMLRKYAHIVDKGLQREDWGPNHSANDYARACDALAHISNPTCRQDPSIVWACDTLEEYKRSQSTSCSGRLLIPASAAPPVSAARALHDIIRGRRSIRHYERRSVTAEVISTVAEAIVWSPTSCNRQPAKVFATLDPQLATRCLKLCKGFTGFGDYVPSFLCFCADMRPYSLPAEIWLPIVDTALGVQNCCLVAHSLGLSVTLLSWAQSTATDERDLRELLGIAPYYHIVVNGAMGYPKHNVDPPARKSMGDTLVLR